MHLIKFLKDTYYNPENPEGFSSVDKLYKAAKNEFPSTKKSEIKNWLSSQLTYSLHKPVRKFFKRNRIIVSYINQQFQIDLADMSNLSRNNNGFKYIFTCIDLFSKYAWAIPVKDKKSESIIKCLNIVFEQRKPHRIQSDKGLEFNNSKVKRLFKSNNINYFVTQNEDIKCSIVERFNRTLKSKLYKYMTFKNTKKYVDCLDKVMKSYNNSIHRKTKMKPINVNLDNQKQVFQNLYDGKTLREILKDKIKGKIKKGSNIRISKSKNKFSRGYNVGWSDEIFTINKRIKNKIPLYSIKDRKGENIEGKFYPQEVQKVKITPESTYRIEKVLRKRKNRNQIEYLVKWLGYDKSHNSWVRKSDLTK